MISIILGVKQEQSSTGKNLSAESTSLLCEDMQSDMFLPDVTVDERGVWLL